MTDTIQASSNIFAVGTTPKIPANLLYALCQLEIAMQFRRNTSVVGLGTITVQGFIGKDAAIPTNNSQFFQIAITDADDRDVFPSPIISILTNTTGFSTRNISPGEAGTNSGFLDIGTNFDVTADMYIHWIVLTTMNANNNIDFLGFKVSMVSL